MADKTVFICSFLLLALCIVAAAAIAFYAPNPCVYRKLKLGRSGGEVRPGWRVN
jgi:hypothetical protein